MNIVFDDISEHIDQLVNTFEAEGKHCESEWFSSLVSFDGLQSDFQAVCDSLILDKRVLPLYLRSDPCVFIFRESGYYFRVRFLQCVDVEVSGVLILIDFETSVRLFPEILEHGCDERFVSSNIVDFCVSAVASGVRCGQDFPASDVISIRDWFRVVGLIQERLSIVPLKIGTSEFVFRSGEMVIKCSYHSVVVDDGYDDIDSDPDVESVIFVEMLADVPVLGCLE